MVSELIKCGAKAGELEDGIEITGADLAAFKPANIECWDDHRVAMSFAVLGTKAKN
jgi:5-enolpyruvylshikimate-3-phosphate synthase